MNGLQKKKEEGLFYFFHFYKWNVQWSLPRYSLVFPIKYFAKPFLISNIFIYVDKDKARFYEVKVFKKIL